MIGLAWLGHATVVLDIGGVRLLTDPLLRRHIGPLRRVGAVPDPALWAGTDAVLVSHLHHDHADVPSLRMLSQAPAMAPGRAQAWLHRRGVPTQPVSQRWSTVPGARGQVQVRVVRADHHSRRMPHRPNDACGFLVRSAEVVVWFAGDTSCYPEMAELPTQAGAQIELALLPIHGWGPRLSDGHLDAVAAADVCALVGVRAVLPIHFGTFHPLGLGRFGLGWMQQPRQAFEEALRERAPATSLVSLQPGERATVG